MKKDLPLAIVLVLSAAFASVLSVMGCLRYQAGNAGFYDLGIMEQIAWNLAFRFDLSFLVRGHLRPVFLLIAPLFRLLPHAETLVVIGSLAVASAGTVFYFLGKRMLGPWPGFFLALFFFLHPGTWYLALFDFHPDAFFPLLAGFAILLLEKKRPWFFLGFALAPLLLKETLALPMIVLGAVAFFRGFRKQGVILAAVALVWFLIASFYLVPHFNLAGSYTRFFGLPSLSWTKALYWLFLLLPLGFLPILRPPELLPGLVHSGLVIFAVFPGYYQVESQYAAQFLPFGLWALVSFMARVNWKKIVPLVLGFAFLGHALFAPTPFGIMFYKAESPFSLWIYRVTERDRTVSREIAEHVPPDAPLCVQINLITGGIPHRAKLWPFPEGLGEAQYVLLDTPTGKWIGMNRDETGGPLRSLMIPAGEEFIRTRKGFLF
ncbi:MAG: DUF2079 domain-containing protein [Candidatus Hydrothermia bacterium]